MRLVAFISTAFIASLTADAVAQRQHVAGLIGEPPDTSNWPHPAAPDDNPFPRSTATPAELQLRKEQSQLGKALFWDEQVSVDNTMACGTCHEPNVGGVDGRLGAVNPGNGNFGAFGVIPQAVSPWGTVDYGFLATPSSQIDRSVTPLAPPTMIGAYMFERLFWDSRAGPDFDDGTGTTIPGYGDWAALEDLAVGPPLSDVEMGHELLDWSSGFLQNKIGKSFPLAMVDPGTIPSDVMWIVSMGADYNDVFDTIFASHPSPMLSSGGGVTRERFAAALAHYHRTLIPDYAPIDRGTMTRNQMWGFDIVHRSDCFRCHSASGSPTLVGGVLADPFDNIMSDGFSHGINISGVRRKTATLRNVGLHTKFFSTGHGGDGTTRVFVNNQSDLLDFFEFEPPPLGTGPLTPGERNALADFLFNALTDPRVAAQTAPFDRPQLYSETQPFEANEYGVGTAPGGWSQVPEIIANSPPQILPMGGPSWFKVGVGRAEPGADAYLMIDWAPSFGPTVWVSGPALFLAANPINPQGIGTYQQPLPLTTSMLGVPFYAQWLIKGRRYGVGYSDAARFVPFHW